MIQQFHALLESVPPRLVEIPDAEASLRRENGRWSKKEILGHEHHLTQVFS